MGGSCRQEILDHVIALNEQQRRRLDPRLREYHHDALEKDTLNKRPLEPRPSPHATVISIPRLGGLHIAVAGAKRHRTAIDSLSLLWTVVAITTEWNAVAFVAEAIQNGSGSALPCATFPIMCRESALLFRSTPMAGISDQIAV